MRILSASLPALLTLVSATAGMTDAQVKQAIIRESIAGYPGPCACPYNVDRRGHACGRRSAYSRPGGYSPLCYPSDVTPEMVWEFRKQRGL